VKQYNARWYAENAEYEAAKYQEQREELRAYYRTRRAANPGAETVYSTAWRKANPEKWALRNRENQRRRRGDKPVSYATILERDGMVCHLCSGPIAGLDDLHMDHVIPLARGGEHNEQNIKPAHALCNMRKGSRVA
jgi:5-methylcytosine-specific restriction endonuclease McrA